MLNTESTNYDKENVIKATPNITKQARDINNSDTILFNL